MLDLWVFLFRYKHKVTKKEGAIFLCGGGGRGAFFSACEDGGVLCWG